MMKTAVWSRLSRRSAAIVSVGVCASMLAAQASAQANNGPVRLVRFSSLRGGVEWRPTASTSWSDAAINLPIREGAQVWVPAGTLAELMFDDGTVMRLASNSTATLQSLYSDKNGEFTEIKLSNGVAYMHAPHAYSIYQFDTPDASIKVDGPARFRLNAGPQVKLAMYSGQAAVENDSGTSTIGASQYAYISGPSAAVATRSMPPVDDFDNYNSTRDTVLFRSDPYVPHNVGLVSGELDSYGHWVSDAQYGHVWEPNETAGWQPYHNGHWVFVDPYGWTWVGNEAWGWAPYHYGSWVHRNYGWGWYPGPATQYWSPAVVSFTYGNFGVSWAPLCPAEVQYPSAISLGFTSGDWSLYFSIGGAAVYAPGDNGYCSPHPWYNTYLNQRGGWNNGGGFYNGYAASNTRFIPRNSRFGGAVTASLAGFRSGQGFHSAGPGGYRNFQSGRSLGFSGRQPLSGPPHAAPDSRSFTPRHAFASRAPSATLFNRHVVAASAASFRRAGAGIAARPNPAARPGGSFARPGTPNRPMAARPTMNRAGATPRWNSNARTNPALAAAAARRSLNYSPKSGRVAATRRAPATATNGERTMRFSGRNPRAGTPTRTAPARANRPANHARRSAPVRNAPVRTAPRRSAPVRNSFRPNPAANRPARQPRRSQPVRSQPARRAPQPSPFRSAPRPAPRQRAPRGGGGFQNPAPNRSAPPRNVQQRRGPAPAPRGGNNQRRRRGGG